MSRTAAQAKVRSALQAKLQQPIVVAYGKRRFTLHPSTARVGWDVPATVDEAIARSRQGNIISRTWRGLTGGTVNADLAPTVTYSRHIVRRLWDGVVNELALASTDVTNCYPAPGD